MLTSSSRSLKKDSRSPDAKDTQRTRGQEMCLIHIGPKDKDQGQKPLQAYKRPRYRSVIWPSITSRYTELQQKGCRLPQSTKTVWKLLKRLGLGAEKPTGCATREHFSSPCPPCHIPLSQLSQKRSLNRLVCEKDWNHLLEQASLALGWRQEDLPSALFSRLIVTHLCGGSKEKRESFANPTGCITSCLSAVMWLVRAFFAALWASSCRGPWQAKSRSFERLGEATSAKGAIRSASRGSGNCSQG